MMYITLTLALLLISSIVFMAKSRRAYKAAVAKDAEVEKVYKPISTEEATLSKLTNDYSELQSNYKKRLAELHKGEDTLSKYDLGVGTTDSTSYIDMTEGKTLEQIESQLEQVKTTLKRLVSEKKACVCNMSKNVQVNGRRSEAKKLLNREIKLRLRCLDNEFKAAAELIDWNNANRLVRRVKDTFHDINASGDTVKTYLTNEYLELKIKELRLGYELNQLKQDIKEEEKEEARIIREAEREEKRIKAAAEKATKERKLMEKLVAEELKKLGSSTEEQKALYELHKLELEKLQARETRALSLAQLTRSGYVYIISNKASFGENIVKIGMTRRANPQDRVKELGDASVPELFDVHAFTFTDDAPKLEKYLHNLFAEKRVNLVNGRKEFFYTTPDEVLQGLSKYDGHYEITLSEDLA